MSKRLSIDNAIDLASRRGGRCLSKVYVNSITKLKWECINGHTWDTTYDKRTGCSTIFIGMDDKPTDSEEVIMAYLDSNEESTPVSELEPDLLIEEDIEEKTPTVQRWWIYPLDYLLTKLTDDGIENIVTYDEYLEPSVIISWQNSKLAHIRLIMGNDDDEYRTKYISYSFGLQGAGTTSVRKELHTFDLKAMDQIYYDTLSFKRMCDALSS